MCSIAVISPGFTEAELAELAGLAPVKHEWTPESPAICVLAQPQPLPDKAWTVFYHCTPKFAADLNFVAAAEEARRVASQVQPQLCVNANAYSFPQLLHKLQQLLRGQLDEPQTIVLVPVGIPALGKSTLVTSIRELLDPNWSFTVVSSDAIRREEMEKYMRKNHTKNLDLAFEKTCKSGPTAFFQRVEQSLNSKKSVHVLVLDKNHPPNAIGKTLETLRRRVPRGRQLKTVLVLPETQPASVGGKKFPMSFSLLLQAMVRLKDRPDHDTLTGSLPKRLRVLLFMYSLYANTSFQGMKIDFDYAVTYPYTDENLEPDDQFKQLVAEELMTSSKDQDVSAELTEYIEVCALDQSPLDPHNFMEQFIDVLQASRPNPQPASVIRKKPPMYIGVCLHADLAGRLVSFVCDVLEDLMSFYPNEPSIRQDFEALAQARQTSFRPAGTITEAWSFPQSLHLTTLFLGRDKAALASPLYTQFQEARKVLVALKTLVYAPGRLICAMAETDPQQGCINKFPHVTLLLSKWPAKRSNDLLENLEPSGSTQATLATLDGESFPVFMYEMNPAHYLQGVTKAFD